MCKDYKFGKTQQELDALKNAKMVIAKVLESYAMQNAQKNSDSATKHENNSNKLDELISKCSLQVTEEVAESHFTYDMAIHVMNAVGLILAGRTAEFKIVTDWKLPNQSNQIEGYGLNEELYGRIVLTDEKGEEE